MSKIWGNGIINFESEEWLDEPFGDALRQLRRNEEMTMTQLSKKSGISQSYISQLENNVRLPSTKVITSISSALARGVTTGPLGEDDFDRYINDFEVESRAQDFESLFTKIKLANESKNLKNEYYQQLNESGELETVTLSEQEIQLLKKSSTLNSNQYTFLLEFIDFLNTKN